MPHFTPSSCPVPHESPEAWFCCIEQRRYRFRQDRALLLAAFLVAGGNVLSSGLVTNIAHPEGNITGVSTNAAETYGKWVELLKETVPSLSHLAIVADSANSSNRQAVECVVEMLRLQSGWYGLPSLDELPSVLTTARAEGADGLLVLSSGVISNKELLMSLLIYRRPCREPSSPDHLANSIV